VFVGDLRSEMTAALDELDTAVPNLDWLGITDRASGAIMLSRYEAAPELRNLRRIKAEVQRRWGTVALTSLRKLSCAPASSMRSVRSPGAARCRSTCWPSD
jgi:hypothetical protein